MLLFLLGSALGRARFRSLWGRLPLVDMTDLDRTEAWFARHGGKAVFFGRMIPIFRSLISIPAGIEGMPLPKFLLLTTAGSGIWNTLFVVAGYQLGENWHLVESYAGVLQKVVIVVVLGLVAWWLVRRVRTVRDRAGASRDGQV
ncbi:DedA family protein [Ornithinimicrobium flavum]|uniref:DedA family protein n=1 Tax=Ornithinimicrobium flavum TaxID=1288636 RepID=UPI0030842890